MTYQVSTGNFFDAAGHFVGKCYAGHGPGVNTVADAALPNVGPIPPGCVFRVGPPTDHIGPLTFALTLVEGNEEGRSSFYIHGDNAAMNHSASEGCIVAAHETRAKIAELLSAGDTELETV